MVQPCNWPAGAREITSASRKIISICLGQQSWLANASAYWKQRLQPSPVDAQAY